ncbi:MAG: hypothetical protein KAG53_11980 [Endozoicomonadaceae bacterium]|nr:hypothetical protein [Endozoicomonadaceae bacterium]
MKLIKMSLLALSISVCGFSIASAPESRFDGFSYETDRSVVATELKANAEWVDGMMVDRQGSKPDSNMTALGLHQNVKNSSCYLVSPLSGLTETDCTEDSINLEHKVHGIQKNAVVPKHIEITANWLKDTIDISGSENILGDNVILSVNSDKTVISIPVVEANDSDLMYYGATLITPGSNVVFPNQSYPIWAMELGKYYVDNYLMTEAGKGFYLEYHYDRPHWHQPMSEDADGFYLLAKDAGTNEKGETIYHLTGFKIPYGKAVYSKMGAIHADAGLTGHRWVVGYSDSVDFSTALVRNRNGEMIRFKGPVQTEE